MACLHLADDVVMNDDIWFGVTIAICVAFVHGLFWLTDTNIPDLQAALLIAGCFVGRGIMGK
jgi:hypothetical protein